MEFRHSEGGMGKRRLEEGMGKRGLRSGRLMQPEECSLLGLSRSHKPRRTLPREKQMIGIVDRKQE